MYDSRTRLCNQVVEEVRQHFQDMVFKTLILRNVRLSEAPSYGQPVIHYDPTCKGAVAYRAFAKEFIARTPTRFNEVDTLQATNPEATEMIEQPASDAPVSVPEATVAETESPVTAETIAIQETEAGHDQVS